MLFRKSTHIGPWERLRGVAAVAAASDGNQPFMIIRDNFKRDIQQTQLITLLHTIRVHCYGFGYTARRLPR